MMKFLHWFKVLIIMSRFAHGASASNSEYFRLDPDMHTMSTFLSTESYVLHLEIDKLTPGNILFGDGGVLKTTDGTATTTVANDTKTENRFGLVRCFHQIDSHRVLLTSDKHCVISVDRSSRRTSLFAGVCNKAGYRDGERFEALFNSPWYIMLDLFNQDRYIIADAENRALRSVDTTSGFTSTILQSTSSSVGFRPRLMTQDDRNGDIFITTYTHKLFRFDYVTKTIVLLSGDNGGFKDGLLCAARYNYPFEMLLINNYREMILADEKNNRLRILDLKSNITKSICDGVGKAVGGPLDRCSIYYPYSLLVMDDTLYVGSYNKIRKIRGAFIIPITTETLTTNPTTTTLEAVKTLPESTTSQELTTIHDLTTGSNSTSTSMHKTSAPKSCKPKEISHQLRMGETVAKLKIEAGRHLVLGEGEYTYVYLSGDQNCTVNIIVIPDLTSTTPKPNCEDKNLTVTIGPGQTHADVVIEPGHVMTLSSGEFTYKSFVGISTCTIHISVKDGNKLHRCPEIVTKVVDSVTHLSSFDLILGNSTHRLKLPVGEYEYETFEHGINCSLTVRVIGHYVVRRLQLTSKYDVKCKLLSDKITLSTLHSVVNSNFKQIEGICQQDCKRRAGSKATIQCSDDLLTISWPTDVTYKGDVISVPDALNQKITDRLGGQVASLLHVIIINRTPPVVYPMADSSGNYAFMELTSSCLKNKTYNQKSDSCQ